MDETQRTEVALFRYSLIAPLLAKDLSPEHKSQIRREILAQKHHGPGCSRHKTVSERSLRRYLHDYRHGGFEALKPKARSDTGSLWGFSQEALGKAVALKEELPARSVRQIIEMLDLDPKTQAKPGNISHSTLARHLKRLGKTKKELKPKAPLRRYQRAYRNALWQSDVLTQAQATNFSGNSPAKERGKRHIDPTKRL